MPSCSGPGTDRLIRRLFVGAAWLWLFVPRAASACSLSPNVDRRQFWARVEWTGYILAAISIAAVAVLAWRIVRGRAPFARSWLVLALLLALAIAQPAWWINAYMGDCGTSRNTGAFLVAVLSTWLLVRELRQLRRVAASTLQRAPHA